MAQPAIKAIIFDCFGVLVGSGLEPFLYDFFRDDPAKMEAAHELDHKANMGHISYGQLIDAYSELSGVTADEVRRRLDENPPNRLLLNYIETELKPNYKIGMLSNAADNWLKELFTHDQLALFDEVVLSCEVGMIKPDERIFELAAIRLEVLPEECVMVDDIERYAVAAHDAGMQALHYQSFDVFKYELEDLLDRLGK